MKSSRVAPITLFQFGPIESGERALTPALPMFYSLRNNFHSATPWALRMSAVTGQSSAARGTVSSFKPASCGRRLPLRAFTSLLDHTRFSHVSAPPRERGRTWSRLPSSGFSNLPVYWQRLPSRSRIVLEQSFGRFFGTLAKFTATITVGTRIAPRVVRTALSPSRTGSVIHSSHVTGRMCSLPSMSSAVATFVAIWQKASAGVRMLIACQLRLSTSTIVLFNMSLIKYLHTAAAPRGEVFVLCWYWAQDRILRLCCQCKAIVASGMAVEPMFPKVGQPTAAVEAAQGQHVLGAGLTPEHT